MCHSAIVSECRDLKSLGSFGVGPFTRSLQLNLQKGPDSFLVTGPEEVVLDQTHLIKEKVTLTLFYLPVVPDLLLS